MEREQPVSAQRGAQRFQILAELEEFTSNSERHLESVLSELGWNIGSLKDSKKMVQCPVNSNHYVHQSSLQKHIQYCQWLVEGYTKQEFEESYSSKFFYEKAPSVVSITIDQQTQDQILSACNGFRTTKPVPRTARRSQINLTEAERLAIYDYVVQRSKDVQKEPVVNLDEIGTDLEQAANRESKRQSEKDFLQKLKEERDFKRRRQSYRAKNVHITKRSKTDVLREIIEIQMKELEEACGGRRSPERDIKEERENETDSYKRDTREAREIRRRSRSKSREDDRRRSGRYRNSMSPSSARSYVKKEQYKHSSTRKEQRDGSRSVSRKQRSRSSSSSRSYGSDHRRRHSRSRSRTPIRVKQEQVSDHGGSENSPEREEGEYSSAELRKEQKATSMVKIRKESRSEKSMSREESRSRGMSKSREKSDDERQKTRSHVKHKKHKDKHKHKKSKHKDRVTVKDEPQSD